MKAGGGKAKGANFERFVCKKLSKWLSAGEREDLLWRSAMSGGRATVAHRKGKKDDQVGDICATSTEGLAFTNRFAVECKYYRDIQMESLLTQHPGKDSLLKFWNEIDLKAAEVNRLAMLVFKQNQGETWVLMRQHVVLNLWDSEYAAQPAGSTLVNELILMRLNDFLEAFKWEKRREASANR
jgi:hypothetical protein